MQKNDSKVALGARAELNGVVIYDNDFERRKIGFKASVNSKTGELTSTRITDNFTEHEQILLTNSIEPTQTLIMLAVLAAITLLTIILDVSWISVAIGFFMGFVWLDNSWAFKTFFKTRYQKSPDEIAQAKFHAAIHKALNAYETYHRLPTIDEVQHASMYSPTCASLDFLTKGVFMTIMIVVYVFVSNHLVPSLAMPLMLPFMFFFTIRKPKIFQKLEKIILLEPGEKEIECAIEALKGYENYNYWRKN